MGQVDFVLAGSRFHRTFYENLLNSISYVLEFSRETINGIYREGDI